MELRSLNNGFSSLMIVAEIYAGIQVEMSSRLTDQDHISNLAKDIYGGMTGDQVGRGHGHGYWFYEEDDLEVKLFIKKKGARKEQVSKEAKVLIGFAYDIVIGLNFMDEEFDEEISPLNIFSAIALKVSTIEPFYDKE